MPTEAPSPVPPDASPRPARPLLSFEPEDPYLRTLNRIKGEGRRRIVAGLVAMNVPLSRVPAVLRRENITAAEYVSIARANRWPLSGELLPDLLPGEIEQARLLWLLPKDDRVISLRARPFRNGALWRAVDDAGNDYRVRGEYTSWVASDVIFLARKLDAIESDSLPFPLGALSACWEAASRLGYAKQAVRDSIVVRSITHGRALRDEVDEEFEFFWNGAPYLPRTGDGEVIQ